MKPPAWPWIDIALVLILVALGYGIFSHHHSDVAVSCREAGMLPDAIGSDVCHPYREQP